MHKITSKRNIVSPKLKSFARSIIYKQIVEKKCKTGKQGISKIVEKKCKTGKPGISKIS